MTETELRHAALDEVICAREAIENREYAHAIAAINIGLDRVRELRAERVAQEARDR